MCNPILESLVTILYCTELLTIRNSCMVHVNLVIIIFTIVLRILIGPISTGPILSSMIVLYGYILLLLLFVVHLVIISSIQQTSSKLFDARQPAPHVMSHVH